MAGIPITPDPSALLRQADPQLGKAALSVTKLAALMPVAPAADGGVESANNSLVQQRGVSLGPDGRPLPGGRMGGTTSTIETLSFAARAILDVMDHTEAAGSRAARPAMPAPPSQQHAAAELRQALTTLLTQSGMFYESHVAEWAQGSRALSTLLAEPQAQQGRAAQQSQQPQSPPNAPGTPAQPSPAAGQPGTPQSPAPVLLLPAPPPGSTGVKLTGGNTVLRADGEPDGDADTPAVPMRDARSMRGAQVQTGHAAHPGSSFPVESLSRQAAEAYAAVSRGAGQAAQMPAGMTPDADGAQAGRTERADGWFRGETAAPNAARQDAQGGPPIHPATEGLVRQQLELLATQQFRWAGEAWPGTPMEWEVERHQGESSGLESGTHAWTTRLVVELPRLGRIETRLTLSGTGIEALVTTAQRASATRLNDARSALAGSLSSNGLALMRLTVDPEG